MQFPLRLLRETVSHFGSELWDVLSRGAPTGNCVPFCGSKVGRAFPESAHWESASHFGTVARFVRLLRK